MAAWDDYIDWSGCELVERVPERYPDGRSCAAREYSPTQSFRMRSLDPRSKKSTKNYPDLPLDDIRRLLAFAHAHNIQRVS